MRGDDREPEEQPQMRRGRHARLDDRRAGAVRPVTVSDEPILANADIECAQHERLLQQPRLLMAQTTYLQIMHHLTTVPPEAGGPVFSMMDHAAIIAYHADDSAKTTSVSYTLVCTRLAEPLRVRRLAGLTCVGVAHSHPPGYASPSFGDMQYVQKVFVNPKNVALTQFCLPIVCDGVLWPYVIFRDEPTIAHMAQLILF